MKRQRRVTCRISVQLPPELIEEIETLARFRHCSRQAQLEYLIRAGLEATREFQGGLPVAPYPPLRKG
jgi:hypothetical protein